MSHSASQGGDDRRNDVRVRTEMFLNQYVREQPYRALATNVSPHGLFLQKLAMPRTRHARSVALEFELPGTGEIIWASAECRFDAVASDFHLTGLRFKAMAQKHERLIRDYVREKEWALERMWLRLRYGGGNPANRS
jgi:PilZ domain-containing protein